VTPDRQGGARCAHPTCRRRRRGHGRRGVRPLAERTRPTAARPPWLPARRTGRS